MKNLKAKINSGTRMLSVDVFRGMTIFLMIIVNTPGSWSYVYGPLRHSSWHGCSFADLVFPSFIFVVGISMSLSFAKKKCTKDLLKNLFRRSVLIFIIGVLLNWFPFFYTNIENLRILGVLQRIALSFLMAGLIVIFISRTRLILIASLMLLCLHWFILYFYGGLEPYSLTGNISKEIDLFVLNGKNLYHGYKVPFDPEGILGTISTASQILLGFIAGKYIYQKKSIPSTKLFKLICLSIFMIIFGLMWNVIYPINKPLWTGSFVIYTTGIFLAFLSFLIWIVDIKKKIFWSFLFIVFGKNALISYLLSIVALKTFLLLIKIEGDSLYVWLFQQVFFPFFSHNFASLLYAISFTLFIWLFSYILFLKKKTIKI